MSTRAVVLQDGRELQSSGDILAAFGEFLRLRVADGDASPATLRAYRGEVGRFVAWCKTRGTDPARASEDDLAEYRRDLVQKGYARSTIALKLAAVRRLYEAATWHGLRQDNPAAGLKAPRDKTDPAATVRYLPLAGFARILDMPRNARDRAMLYLMGGHGLRVAEVAALRLSDLDTERGTLQVIGKGSKARTVYLTPRTVGILQEWLAERQASPGENRLFVSRASGGQGEDRHPGHGMTARGIRHIVDGYLYAAGLKDTGISCHALRHSMATWSLAGGASLAQIGAKLGHSSVTTTERYARVLDAARHNPTNALEPLLFSEHAGSEDI